MSQQEALYSKHRHKETLTNEAERGDNNSLQHSQVPIMYICNDYKKASWDTINSASTSQAVDETKNETQNVSAFEIVYQIRNNEEKIGSEMSTLRNESEN